VGVGSFQVGGRRFQKVAVVEYPPVLKEYPLWVLQEEGDARVSDEVVKSLLTLYL